MGGIPTGAGRETEVKEAERGEYDQSRWYTHAKCHHKDYYFVQKLYANSEKCQV